MSDSARPPRDPGTPSNVVAFAPERRERLRQIVRSRHAVRVEELKTELGVSTATIRRDLDELAGKVSRFARGEAVVQPGSGPAAVPAPTAAPATRSVGTSTL